MNHWPDSAKAPIVVDACVVINVAASRVMPSIFSALARPIYVCEHVAKYEALRIRSDTNQNGYETIDLDSLIESGTINLTAPTTNREKDLVLQLASEGLDNGESHCIAVAASRGWAIATDDRKAIACLQRLPEFNGEVLQTVDIVNAWAHTPQQTGAEIKRVVCQIESCANFRPPNAHPLTPWWLQNAA